MPDGFYIGPIKIYFYGIIIMVGVLFAIWVSLGEARRRELNSEHVWDMVPWLLFFGLVGARLWHVLTPSKSLGVGVEHYMNNPLEILEYSKGGIGNPRRSDWRGVWIMDFFYQEKNPILHLG